PGGLGCLLPASRFTGGAAGCSSWVSGTDGAERAGCGSGGWPGRRVYRPRNRPVEGPWLERRRVGTAHPARGNGGPGDAGPSDRTMSPTRERGRLDAEKTPSLARRAQMWTKSVVLPRKRLERLPEFRRRLVAVAGGPFDGLHQHFYDLRIQVRLEFAG